MRKSQDLFRRPRVEWGGVQDNDNPSDNCFSPRKVNMQSLQDSGSRDKLEGNSAPFVSEKWAPTFHSFVTRSN